MYVHVAATCDVIVLFLWPAVEDIRLQFDAHLDLDDLAHYDAVPGYFFKFTDFESVPEKTFAEQLTYIDSVSLSS